MQTPTIFYLIIWVDATLKVDKNDFKYVLLSVYTMLSHIDANLKVVVRGLVKFSIAQ